MTVQSATNPDEIPGLLTDNNISLDGMNKEKLEKFFASISFENGGLAHFHYADVITHLSEQDFDKLLIIIGTNKDKFLGFKDKFCGGSIQARRCFDNPGEYCDPAYCRSA